MAAVIHHMISVHVLWLVMLAALLCLAGASITLRAFARARVRSAHRGWTAVTALTAGTFIWTVHFIAMISYEPGVPVLLDMPLLILSLAIAVLGPFPGFRLAMRSGWRAAPFLGGGILGLTIAAMHYVGMAGYFIAGETWTDPWFLAASVVLGVLFGGLALALDTGGAARWSASLLLTLAVVGTHFTGMAGLHIVPGAGAADFDPPELLHAVAIILAALQGIILAAACGFCVIDARDEKDSDIRVQKAGLVDPLTGVSNRNAFNRELKDAIGRAVANCTQLALIAVDIDRFRDINERWGHIAGDEVLRQVAKRIRPVLPAGSHIARVDGDEFAILLPLGGSSDPGQWREHVAGVTEAILQAVRPTIRYDIFEIYVSIRIGVALFPEHAMGPAGLIGNAQVALEHAARIPGETTCVYDFGLDEKVRVRRQLAVDLRKALGREELRIHYQTQQDLNTGRITGFEALLRWIHPERGFVSPLEFIPSAEKTGLILPIGAWVLRHAIRDAASWNEPYTVAINVSPYQLVYSDLPGLLGEILAETGIDPGRVELELTESALVEDADHALRVLAAIREMGVSLALDDFGTGYSSLVALRTYPFDKLKLDKSLIDGIESSAEARAMVRAMIELGHYLDKAVLAEGVETRRQLDILTRNGCDAVQGFLFGKPAPQRQFIVEGVITRKGAGAPARRSVPA